MWEASQTDRKAPASVCSNGSHYGCRLNPTATLALWVYTTWNLSQLPLNALHVTSPTQALLPREHPTQPPLKGYLPPTSLSSPANSCMGLCLPRHLSQMPLTTSTNHELKSQRYGLEKEFPGRLPAGVSLELTSSHCLCTVLHQSQGTSQQLSGPPRPPASSRDVALRDCLAIPLAVRPTGSS